MTSYIIFSTTKKDEAERLLPFVAKVNGGRKLFSVEKLTGNKSIYGLCYNIADGYTFTQETSDHVSSMRGFLIGFLASETNVKQQKASISKAREDYRKGRR